MKHFWVFLVMGMTMFAEGRAESSLERLAEARMYLREGDLERSLRTATQAIRMDPTNSQALKLRGNIHCLMEDFSKAKRDFDDLIAFAPTATAYIDRAITQLALKDYQGAAKDIDQAMALRPGHSLALALREKIACKVNF